MLIEYLFYLHGYYQQLNCYISLRVNTYTSNKQSLYMMFLFYCVTALYC